MNNLENTSDAIRQNQKAEIDALRKEIAELKLVNSNIIPVYVGKLETLRSALTLGVEALEIVHSDMHEFNGKAVESALSKMKESLGG